MKLSSALYQDNLALDFEKVLDATGKGNMKGDNRGGWAVKCEFFARGFLVKN